MRKVYADNGLPFYEADDIRDRTYLSQLLADGMRTALLIENPAWTFYQCEAPSLIPMHYISSEYNYDDFFVTKDDLALRPETTAASYGYAFELLGHDEAKPPLCVWQLARSYRRENDQVTRNVRLKEFYQQEFQCIFRSDTHNDYQHILPQLQFLLENFTGCKSRIIASDRVPSYSEQTLDIELKVGGKWLEVCSSSKRRDCNMIWESHELKNLEFAFGIDRILYAKRNKYALTYKIAKKEA